MSQEIINIGTLPNDGEGDPLRVAFGKINNNFSTLYSTSTETIESYSTGTTSNQVIWQKPIGEFSQGKFQILSSDTESNESQNITISAHITNDLLNVKWTGYGTTFNDSAITSYNMDISGGNVRILVTPLIDSSLQHFIASSITYITE